MRWNSFARSLLFAAVAAAAYVPFAILATPHLGPGVTLAVYSVLCGSTYLAGLGATLRQGFGAALLAGTLGTGLLFVAPSPRDAILGAALLLGLGRSGILYRARFARTVLLESVLLVAGLAFAGHLQSGAMFSSVLAVWAFFLVQSGFFLVGGVKIRRGESGDADPFEAARARALEILEQGLG